MCSSPSTDRTSTRSVSGALSVGSSVTVVVTDCCTTLPTTCVTKVDLPAPETPVTVVSCPSGNETSCSTMVRALIPVNFSSPIASCRGAALSSNGGGLTNRAVMDSSASTDHAVGPEYTMRPPCTPACGPTSITQSA